MALYQFVPQFEAHEALNSVGPLLRTSWPSVKMHLPLVQANASSGLSTPVPQHRKSQVKDAKDDTDRRASTI